MLKTAIVLSLATIALTACTDMSGIVDAKPVSLTSRQVAQIEGTVTHDFFDPSSAQFRNVRAVDLTLSNGTKVRRVCGEVNGKNQMGGYVGFNLFGGTLTDKGYQPEDFFGACEAS